MNLNKVIQTATLHTCHAIVVGESTVLQNVVSKLNNAMCVVRLAIFRVCRKRQQNTTRGCGHPTNLVENQTTKPDVSSQNTEYMLLPIKSQLSHPGR